RLTLLGEEDLELDIRIRDIGNRLREAGGRDLARSQARYRTLLGRKALDEADYPLGPEVICLGLRALCTHYSGQIELQLGLLKKIEGVLQQEIAPLYRDLDALLAEAGVELAADSVASGASRRSSTTAPPVNGGETTGNPLSALQQAVRQQRQTPRDSRADAGVDFLLEADDEGEDPAASAATRVMLRHLLERLNALEARSLTAIDKVDKDETTPAAPPLRALKANDLQLPLGLPEAVMLDTLALIFETIFDATELPDAIKAAIARLQIPLVKLAMIDPTLFANRHHPARQLINRISRAAVGLPRSAGWEHPVCRQIGLLSSAVREHLAERDAVLDAFLAELAELIDERDDAVRREGESYLALVNDYENQLYAEHLARGWLRSRLGDTGSSEIASFLEQHWFNVMAAAAVDGGCEGQRWQESSATADDLIWSVLPKPTADERKRLAALASSLVRRINSGLDTIGVPTAQRTPFLNTLFDLQTAALRNQANAGLSPATTAPALVRPATPASGPRLLTRGDQRVHYLAPVNEATQPRRRAAATWQAGEWLRFFTSEPDAVCGLCCWQSPTATSALFFNPDWGYAVVMSSATIDQQLNAGRAEIVSRIALFDAAAERALSVFAAR
ncbi:MAG: DUF1631 family protein, partial [Elusimicrobia bacterium]